MLVREERRKKDEGKKIGRKKGRKGGWEGGREMMFHILGEKREIPS